MTDPEHERVALRFAAASSSIKRGIQVLKWPNSSQSGPVEAMECLVRAEMCFNAALMELEVVTGVPWTALMHPAQSDD